MEPRGLKFAVTVYLGFRVAERIASGKIVNSDVDMTIGNLPDANVAFEGTIAKVEVSNEIK